MSDRDFKSIQCTAKSKASGKQCRRRAIKGGRVCQMHGGAAPQTKAKAAENVKEWRLRRALQIDKGLDVFMNDKKGRKLAKLIEKSPPLLPRLIDLADQMRGGVRKTALTDPDGGPLIVKFQASEPQGDEED